MSSCGPNSQCKTNRCYCKQNNQLCKQNCSKCKCTNSICVNRSQSSLTDYEDYEDHLNDLKCNCQKGKCKSNTNCGCIKSNKRCNQKCSCTNCENINSSKLNVDLNGDEEFEFKKTKNKLSQTRYSNLEKACSSKNENQSVSGPELIADLNDLASYISQKIRVPVTNKKDVVFEFRSNIDLYTRIPKEDVENPQVDHIIEDQLVGHAAAHVFQGKQAFEPYLDVLKESVNLESLDNYNVTFRTINGSKGSILKRYLRDGINKGFPLRALIDPASHFGKNMEPIFQVMNNTHEIVEEYIAEGRRSDGHITGNNKYKEIAEELSDIIKEMKLDVNEERKTRNSNRK